MDVQVRKKDGRLDPFDRNKILNGLLKSGTSQAEAENVTVQVEAWVPGVALSGVVNSSDLKSKALELLRGVNPAAAAAFESYQKPSAPAESAGESAGPMGESGEPPTGAPPEVPPGVPPAGSPPPPPPPGTPVSPPPAV